MDNVKRRLSKLLGDQPLYLLQLHILTKKMKRNGHEKFFFAKNAKFSLETLMTSSRGSKIPEMHMYGKI